MIIILGAGLTGLIASDFIEDDDYLILEKSDKTGGIAKSFFYDNYVFDYGGHYLHFRTREAYDFYSKKTNKLTRKERKAYIYVDQKLIPYPIQIYYPRLFPEKKEQIIEHIKKRKINNSNFYEYLKTSFGDLLLNKFFYPYNKKFWKSDLSEMAADWTDKLVPKTTHEKINYPPDNIGYNKNLYYPENGIIEISKNIAKNKNIALNEKILKIELSNKKIITENNTYSYDKLISTIPLIELFKLTGLISYDLEYVSLSILNIGIEGSCPHDFTWIYLPENNTPFFRFGKYILPHEDNLHSFYFETSYKGKNHPNEEEIYNHAYKILKKFNIKGKKQADLFLNLKFAYPVLKNKYKQYFPFLFDQLHKNNIYPAGRMGSWKYISMEDCYFEAKRIVNSLKNKLTTN